MNDIMLFVSNLARTMRATYTPPNVERAHDFTHCDRMLAIAKKITAIKFDNFELEVAIWLHNADRARSLEKAIKGTTGLYCFVQSVLVVSPFSRESTHRIAQAVSLHSKKDDEESDSSLLQALRVCDKIDRLGPIGILSVAAHAGDKLLMYPTSTTFGYLSTKENEVRGIYDLLFRHLEWYGMMPAWGRAMLSRRHMNSFVQFIRDLGHEIAERHEITCSIEDDIRKALGEHYELFTEEQTLVR